MTATVLLLFVLPAAPPADPPADAGPPPCTRTLLTWAADLRGEDAAARRAAADAFIKAGPKAKAAVPTLVKLIGEKNVHIDLVADVLGAIGPDAKEAIPALVAALPNNGTFGGEHIALALAKIDGPNVEATRALLLGTRRCVPNLLVGSQVLGDYPGPVVGHLVALCADKEPHVRAKAAAFLGTLKEKDGGKVPAASLFEKAGDAAKGVAPALEKLLADASTEVRLAAARAITHVAPELAEKALAAVVAVAVETAGKTKSELYAHDTFAPVPEQAAKVLLALFDNPDDSVRRWAIGHMAPLPVVGPVEDALKTGKTARVRRAAAEAIGARYSAGARSAPALTGALKDPAFAVRFAAAVALVQVGERGSGSHAAAIPVLVEGLRQPEEQVRLEASRSLLATGPAATGAVPALKALLGDPKQGVRLAAALALVGIDAKGAADAVPALAEGLTAGDSAAARAVKALLVLGPAGKAAAPALAGLLADEDAAAGAALALIAIDPDGAKPAFEWVRGALAKGADDAHDVLDRLPELGPNAKPLVPDLLAVLKAKVPQHHRRQAIQTLAAIGPGAADALPELKALAEKDPRPDVRKLAADAVKAIEAK